MSVTQNWQTKVFNVNSLNVRVIIKWPLHIQTIPWNFFSNYKPYENRTSGNTLIIINLSSCDMPVLTGFLIAPIFILILFKFYAAGILTHFFDTM